MSNQKGPPGKRVEIRPCQTEGCKNTVAAPRVYCEACFWLHTPAIEPGEWYR